MFVSLMCMGWVPEPLPPHAAFVLRGVGQFSLAKEKRPHKGIQAG
jgi:hypothetical protein